MYKAPLAVFVGGVLLNAIILGLVIFGIMTGIDYFTDGKGLCDEAGTKQETALCKTLKD